MAIEFGRPGAEGLPEAIAALNEWQDDWQRMQLHPGDVGWFHRFGAEAAGKAVRTWSRNGRILAVGLLDGADLLRMTTAPDLRQDEELARRIVEDVVDPERGVLPAGKASVEAPLDALVQDLLPDHGWQTDEPWQPLRLDFAGPVPDLDVRIEEVGPGQADDWAAVLRSAFKGSTAAAERFHAMAAGPSYAGARTLLARDDAGEAAATVTVWSAGPGRLGLIEPMGVHRDHRGRGYGKAITVAALAALQRLGSSGAVVCTISSNAGGVATYKAAGLRPLPEVRDLYRKA